jgi:transketolase
MGISKAKGWRWPIVSRIASAASSSDRDGELQEGQFWESLGSAVNLQLGEIVAIVDHNKIQSDTWVRKVSDLGDLEAKLRAFGWHVRAATATTRRASAHVPFAGCDHGSPEGDRRGHDKRTRCLVHGRPDGAQNDGDLYLFHSGAPPEQQYVDGLSELLGAAGRHSPRSDSVSWRPRPHRNPRREPRETHNLVAAYGKALVQQATSIRI